MKALISYVDFHWDNYQGGSGKSFELTASCDLPDDLKACEFFNYIHKHMADFVIRKRPFKQDNDFSITRIEIV